MITVLLCTHNPRKEYLQRVLNALRAQSLRVEEWELLLIDNACDDPIATRFDVSWHPNARHIREDELGLTPARLRGISEANGELLVFVDDDNVLSSTYLEAALAISRRFLFLGAWGGNITPEFEEEPQAWTRPHWGILAIREFDQTVWSNDPDNWQTQPCGAGLCVRKIVAELYKRQVQDDRVRRQLGRKGSSLLSTEDTDIVLTTRNLDLGWGSFPSLTLVHLIPRFRLTEEYLIRLTEGITASTTALTIKNAGIAAMPYAGFSLLVRRLYRRLRFGARDERFYVARQRGLAAGHRLAKEPE